MNRSFISRHIGPSDQDLEKILGLLGVKTLNELTDKVVPKSIQIAAPLNLHFTRTVGLDEAQVLSELRQILDQNETRRSLIGLGYYATHTPNVILRNITENPGWYTQYTPYQAEISQGRLEALLNYQTLVAELTGLDISNASLLDEGTSAAEAMMLAFRVKGDDTKKVFLIDQAVHPQTIALVETRAWPLGVNVKVQPNLAALSSVPKECFGVLVQYPNSDGEIADYEQLAREAKKSDALTVVASDLLALTMLKPPGEWGADIAVGSAQRFGVPLGFGGPHAAFFAVKDELKRQMPGRLVGVSKDRFGRAGLRLSLQTREQHIRRDKATSNICTSQVLLAVMASMYAVYHGPDGLRTIAKRVHGFARLLESSLKGIGTDVVHSKYFDTLKIKLSSSDRTRVLQALEQAKFNVRKFPDGSLGISCDEMSTELECEEILKCFKAPVKKPQEDAIPSKLLRTTKFLEHAVFNQYHSEHEMLRYIHRLQSKDLSLTASMIPLGSCTMKLNATVEMIPVTWQTAGGIHPFAPKEQTKGYQLLSNQLCSYLGEITGLPGVSLQPNSGSQGEYAGLLVIRAYHEGRNEGHRNICLVPDSAHGTNPASAAMAGYVVVSVKSDEKGDVDTKDFAKKAEENAKNLAASMITYPSTHGVFEDTIKELCDLTHRYGGQVYMDGANMNAQVGLCKPGEFGVDVCHLNLHKTFCIPHGGGGPGVGPICCKEHLSPYLPGHPANADGALEVGGKKAIGPVSAAPLGSAGILPIPWVYIKLMSGDGLKKATQVAIANANYIAKRLEKHFPTLYKADNGFVAHECILDLREFKRSAGVEVEDVAKRLMDYGFHAPTVSWPVAGTLMVEPTESESLAELDRFCEAMIAIRAEIAAIEAGKFSQEDNPLKFAPHTAEEVSATEWSRSYSREQAAYPLPYLRNWKYWPPVARIDSVYGDRNLFCSCS